MIDLLFALLFATLPACAEEDSINCAWNAHLQGNLIGRSFVNLDGEVHFIR